MKNIILFACICFLASGCASSGDLAQQQRKVTTQEQRLMQLEDLRPVLANQNAEIDQLKSRIGALEGRIDELNRKLDIARQPPPSATGAPGGDNIRITPYPEKTRADKYAEEPPASAEQEMKSPSSAASVDPAQALYDKALQQFNANNYPTAQATWGEFLQKYKSHPLAPNALFWQGECHYQQRDYPKAILAYQEVIGKYPKSPKYPTALLKQGISFVIIGKKDAGKLVLNDVIKKFPNSPEAKRADEFLHSAN